MPLVAVLVVYVFVAIMITTLSTPLILNTSLLIGNTALLSYGTYRSIRYGFEPKWEQVSSILLMLLTLLCYSWFRIKQEGRLDNFLV